MHSVKYLPYIMLFLVLPLYATCQTGESSHAIPAVIGQDGGLIAVSVKIIPGSGNIYLTTSPQTGVSTQVSANDAVNYAFKRANQNIQDCDVLVDIHGEEIAPYVDGPSAGVSFSTITYSALTGIPIRDDATMTGGIDQSGSVTRVGGLYEKARAASRYELSYFLTPANTLDEKILLNRLEKRYNLSVLEITTADQAIDFLFYNKTIPEIPFRIAQTTLPNVTSYKLSEKLADFIPVSKRIMQIENDSINKIVESDSNTLEIKNQFLGNIDRQNHILNRGYLFTAANEAFSSYISVLTIAAAEETRPDVIQNEQDTITSCINSLPDIPKTDSNFDYVVGAELRKYWATRRLGSVDFNSSDLAEERYYKYNQLLYADAWCHVSESLYGQALTKSSGTFYNESLLKPLATKKLREISSLPLTNPDHIEKLQTAQLLADNEKYAASIYDSTYVLSMYSADNDVANLSRLEIASRVSDYSNKSTNSLWPELYASHAKFLSQDMQNGGLDSAYHVFVYSDNLDKINSEILATLNANVLSKPDNPAVKDDNSASDSSDLLLDITILYAFVFLVIVVLVVLFTTMSRKAPIHNNKKLKNKKQNI